VRVHSRIPAEENVFQETAGDDVIRLTGAPP
jgi:hypothetical protein